MRRLMCELEKGKVMRHAVRWMACPVFVLLFLVQASLVMAGDLALDNPRAMRFPTVEFNPPDAERLVLDNGMVVYLLEDHELPLVTINATLKTGSWLDPDRSRPANLINLRMKRPTMNVRTVRYIETQ